MAFAAAVSEHPVAADAVGEVLGEVIETGGVEPDLAVVFSTAHHLPMLADVSRAVRTLLRPGHLMGAAAVGVVGRGSEVEDRPGLVLWAGWLPAGVEVRRIAAHRRPGGVAVSGLDPASLPEDATLMVVSDPFSLPVEPFVGHLGQTRPDVTVIGGLASAARSPGGNRLLVDDDDHADGAVAAVFTPEQVVGTVVSQGCRPIGDPMVVTRAEGNLISELAGQSALAQLQGMVDAADPQDRARLAQGIHVGVVIDESKERFGRGDYLVRNVIGADRERDVLAVGAPVEVGTTISFQVRDARTADEDLAALLDGVAADAALLFTCNGRGERLFGAPDHDAVAVTEGLGTQAVAGMFCAGEIGPVGGRNFLHGFTAALLALRA